MDVWITCSRRPTPTPLSDSDTVLRSPSPTPMPALPVVVLRGSCTRSMPARRRDAGAPSWRCPSRGRRCAGAPRDSGFRRWSLVIGTWSFDEGAAAPGWTQGPRPHCGWCTCRRPAGSSPLRRDPARVTIVHGFARTGGQSHGQSGSLRRSLRWNGARSSTFRSAGGPACSPCRPGRWKLLRWSRSDS